MSATRPAAPRWPSNPTGAASLGERALLAALGALVIAGLAAWGCGQLAGLLTVGDWPRSTLADAGGVLLRLPSRLSHPRDAWPPGARGQLPGPVGFYAVSAATLASVAALGLAGLRVAGVLRDALDATAADRDGAAWARPRQLAALRVGAPAPGRLTLGRAHGRLIAAEPRQSAIVIAPTQSLKTTGLAIPAVLEWHGPVLATSVKTDLLRDTLARRRALGDVLIYDPTGCTGIPASGWTPLTGCQTWQRAQRTAAWLCAAARGSQASLADADFWYAAAAKLLAPILLAAVACEATMADVVRWVDTQEVEEIRDVLAATGEQDALIAATATWQRDDRQRSSIYTTAETVLAAYADPGVLASAETAELTAERLLDGGAHTAYLCAPAHEQQRLRPLFATLVQDILAAVYERASHTGAPLDPPLLLVLDEAANIAPLRELDTLAATAAGQGIQLLTVFQDLAQIRERWGDRAATIVNNHRAKLIGAGTADPATLDYLARVLGDQQIHQTSQTAGQEGHASTTQSTTWRTLTPPHLVRQARTGSAVLVYGNLPPTRLQLRPWFADPALRRLARATR